MRRGADDKRILAIDPASRGFGFAVLEGPRRLIDWGVRSAKENKEKRSLKLIERLIRRYEPDAIVVEDCASKGSRKRSRIQELIKGILALAERERVRTVSISRRMVKRMFSESGQANKYKITLAITRQFSELAPRLPPERKPWMSEDYRMPIFGAAALALTYFEIRQK